jgi:hypothetical protein
MLIIARPINIPASIPATTHVYQEIPSGSIDGLNANFSIVNAANPEASLVVIKNGLTMMSGALNDYLVVSTNTFTFNVGSIPTTGSNLFVRYDF